MGKQVHQILAIEEIEKTPSCKIVQIQASNHTGSSPGFLRGIILDADLVSDRSAPRPDVIAAWVAAREAWAGSAAGNPFLIARSARW